MRIVARQKDYYDCVQGTGQDRSLTYVRDTKEEQLDRRWPFPRLTVSNWPRTLCEMHLTVIGFCGKIYPMVEMYIPPSDCKRPIRDRKGVPMEGRKRKCFTLADVDAFINAELSDKRMSEYKERFRQEFVKFFGEFEQDREKHADLFSITRPIFAVEEQGRWDFTANRWHHPIVYNPLLGPYDFMRVFDPFTAFQELQMWLSNQAVPQRPMPEIDDELKAQSHGFNRFSFRKDPGSKKRTRKKGR